jgi:hypothetical protein
MDENLKSIFVTPRPNELVNTENRDGNLAGFWQGLWHGFIFPVTLVMSLFNENVSVYEVHNNGSKYNFGFLLGTMMIFGGGGGSKNYSQK